MSSKPDAKPAAADSVSAASSAPAAGPTDPLSIPGQHGASPAYPFHGVSPFQNLYSPSHSPFATPQWLNWTPSYVHAPPQPPGGPGNHADVAGTNGGFGDPSALAAGAAATGAHADDVGAEGWEMEDDPMVFGRQQAMLPPPARRAQPCLPAVAAPAHGGPSSSSSSSGSAGGTARDRFCSSGGSSPGSSPRGSRRRQSVGDSDDLLSDSPRACAAGGLLNSPGRQRLGSANSESHWDPEFEGRATLSSADPIHPSDLLEPLESHAGGSSLGPAGSGNALSRSDSESSAGAPPSSSNTEGPSSQGSSSFGAGRGMGDRTGQLSRSLSEGTEGSGSGRRDESEDGNGGGNNTSDEENDDNDDDSSHGPGVIWVAAFGLDMNRACFEAKLPHPSALLAPPGLSPSQPSVAAPFAPLPAAVAAAATASASFASGSSRQFGKLMYAPRLVRLPGWRLTFRLKTPVLGVGLPSLLRASDLAAEEALAREHGLLRGLPGEEASDDDLDDDDDGDGDDDAGGSEEDDDDDNERDRDKSRARHDGASSSDSENDDIHARGPPRQRQRSGSSPDRGRSRAKALAQEHAKRRWQAKAAAAAAAAANNGKPPHAMATAAARKYRTNRDPDVEAVLWPVADTPAVLAHLDACHGVPHLGQRKSLTPPAGGFGLGKSVQPLPPSLVAYFPNSSCSLPGTPMGSSSSSLSSHRGAGGSSGSSAALLGGAGGGAAALAAAQAFVPPHPAAHYKVALREAASGVGLSLAYQQWLASLPTLEDAVNLALPPNTSATPFSSSSSLHISAARSLALAGRGLWAATGRVHDPLRLFLEAQLAHAALKDSTLLISSTTAGGRVASSSFFTASNATTSTTSLSPSVTTTAVAVAATAAGASEDGTRPLGNALAICRALNMDLTSALSPTSSSSSSGSAAAMVVDEGKGDVLEGSEGSESRAAAAAAAEITAWQVLQALGKAPSPWKALEHRTTAALSPPADATAASALSSSFQLPPQPSAAGTGGGLLSPQLVPIPSLARSSDSCSSLDAATPLGDDAIAPTSVNEGTSDLPHTIDEASLAGSSSSSTCTTVGSTVLGCLSSVKQVFVCGPCAPDCPVDGLSLFDLLVEKVAGFGDVRAAVLPRALLQDRGQLPSLVLDPAFPLATPPPALATASGAATEGGDESAAATATAAKGGRGRFRAGYERGVRGFVVTCRNSEACAATVALVQRACRAPQASVLPAAVASRSLSSSSEASGAHLAAADDSRSSGGNSGSSAASTHLELVWVCHSGSPPSALYDVVAHGDWARHMEQELRHPRPPWTCVNCADQNPPYKRRCDCGLERGLSMQQVIDAAAPLDLPTTPPLDATPATAAAAGSISTLVVPVLPSRSSFGVSTSKSTTSRSGGRRTWRASRCLIALDGNEEMLYHAEGAGKPLDDHEAFLNGDEIDALAAAAEAAAAAGLDTIVEPLSGEHQEATPVPGNSNNSGAEDAGSCLQVPSLRPLEVDGVGKAEGDNDGVKWVRVLSEAPSAHPERPDRLRAILRHLGNKGLLASASRCPCRAATEQELCLAHPPSHVAKVLATVHSAPVEGGDSEAWRDAYCCPGTARAAQIAAGTTVDLTVAVARGAPALRARKRSAAASASEDKDAPTVGGSESLAGGTGIGKEGERVDEESSSDDDEHDKGAGQFPRTAVALVRPPGHHAEADVCMGFCFYNNAALAAHASLQEGLQRVLVIDWDVHHGNGTQALFEADPRVLYVSLHRYPFYPGTGAPHECGVGDGAGFTVNIGWPEGGIGDAEYLAAFRQVVMPIATAFAPELVIISAGFDAAEGDPLGGCSLTPAGYSAMTHQLLSLAHGRCVLVLEGGYNLQSIARSAEACVRVLQGEEPIPLPADHDASYLLEAADEAILRTAAVHLAHWPCLRRVWGSSLDEYALQMRAERDERSHFLGGGGEGHF